MFLSLNRKIIYSVLSLFLISLLLFTITFYVAYSSKVEKDQLLSIQRNQQYNDLLYRSISLTKELKQLLEEHPNLSLNKKNYQQIYALTYDTRQNDFLINEQKNIAERSKSFDEQYQTIYNGITIIISSALFLALFILFIGWLVRLWILLPINNISHISEQIAHGNLNLRIPLQTNAKFIDELDKLSITFNMMLDNLQNMISEVQDKEKFLQALIDSIPDGIRVIDENYQIVIANKGYYKQTGPSSQHCTTCYASSFSTNSPCDYQHTPCPLHEILNQGKKSVSLIQQFAHKPNCQLSVNAAQLIYDTHHKYIVESIRDLSEDINFSHQQKLSSLSFLSSSIAHEIKNHLGALRIIIEHFISKYYNDTSEESEPQKMINMIHTELVNAIKVPERLLKLTRGDNTVSTEIDCTTNISDVLSLLDFEAKSKGVDIIFEAPKKSICITGNETDFKIAVINIVLNAIKAMPNKGFLTVKLTESKKYGIKITFADTGTGIPKENLPYIFNPFFSEGRQGSSNKGSGLGLAITKSIIEKFGGNINVTSTVGKGSCFTFTFPRNKKLAKN